jgi:hypothetical protein
MAAVPIYVWNGSAWQETGPTIPASPIAYQASAPASPSTGDIWVDSDGDVTTGSQQFQRFRFVASGGETTISGADADGAILAYTAGLEQVILNGAVLVRGQDYTATDGTNITGLSPALVANDVLEVFSFIAFTVANTYTQSQVDGLVNAARAASGLVLINTTSFSAQSTISFAASTFTSTYDNYKILYNFTSSSANTVNLRLRNAGSDITSSNYFRNGVFAGDSAATNIAGVVTTSWNALPTGTPRTQIEITLFSPNLAENTRGFFQGYDTNLGNFYNQVLIFNTTTQVDSLSLYPSTGTVTGTVSVYGYNK